jgi:hypothetical protein
MTSARIASRVGWRGEGGGQEEEEEEEEEEGKNPRGVSRLIRHIRLELKRTQTAMIRESRGRFLGDTNDPTKPSSASRVCPRGVCENGGLIGTGRKLLKATRSTGGTTV